VRTSRVINARSAVPKKLNRPAIQPKTVTKGTGRSVVAIVPSICVLPSRSEIFRNGCLTVILHRTDGEYARDAKQPGRDPQPSMHKALFTPSSVQRWVVLSVN
jgi:hypothetical protein